MDSKLSNGVYTPEAKSTICASRSHKKSNQRSDRRELTQGVSNDGNWVARLPQTRAIPFKRVFHASKKF